MTIRTWHIEMAVVATVLVAVALLSGGGWLELLGAGAVLLSFGHAQVADRLAEYAGAKPEPGDERDWSIRSPVHCYRWATRYLVCKEALWLAYFIAHRSWSALAGVVMFLLYPAWRRWWVKRRREKYPDVSISLRFYVDGLIKRDVQ